MRRLAFSNWCLTCVVLLGLSLVHYRGVAAAPIRRLGRRDVPSPPLSVGASDVARVAPAIAWNDDALAVARLSLAPMSNGQLRALLMDRQVGCVGCLDRDSLISAASVAMYLPSSDERLIGDFTPLHTSIVEAADMELFHALKELDAADTAVVHAPSAVHARVVHPDPATMPVNTDAARPLQPGGSTDSRLPKAPVDAIACGPANPRNGTSFCYATSTLVGPEAVQPRQR